VPAKPLSTNPKQVHFWREVTHCELFESVDALLEATQDFFDRYNRKPEAVRSIIGAHAT
jgi:hypothetical protein